MHWNLEDNEGDLVGHIDQHVHITVSEDGIKYPLVFHGTRDYIDGVIFALELMGHEKFTPKMVDNAKIQASL